VPSSRLLGSRPEKPVDDTTLADGYRHTGAGGYVGDADGIQHSLGRRLPDGRTQAGYDLLGGSQFHRLLADLRTTWQFTDLRRLARGLLVFR